MKKFYCKISSRQFRLSLFLLFFMCGVLPVSGEESSLDSYYYSPFSLEASYQPLSALAFVEHKSNMSELSFQVRIPLPFLPSVQPFVLGGLLSVDSDEKDEPTILGGVLDEDAAMPDYDEDNVWDHQYWFGALGAGYAHHISKEFEVGADTYFGFGMSRFEQRVVTSAGEWYPVGEPGILAGAAGNISLNPSFNLNIRISPSVRYIRSVGNMHDFDGLYFGVGFSGSYRYGADPDAPGREVKSIQFSRLSVPSLFAAMQSYYARNPIGSVTITNTEKRAVENVEVSFLQDGFMDSPTPSASLERLEAGASAEAPLYASFNREVFSTEGITPLTGEIQVSYTFEGRPVEQSKPVSYDLYDKTAMTWDDDAKVAAFITPSDSALRNYTSFIRQACKDNSVRLPCPPLEFSIQAFHALSEIGILYQSDPTLPFTAAQEDTGVVDSISLPRDTLKRITGDCDDLTVLYCSLLETVGIETGFITVPGHIYAAFNTKTAARDYGMLHPDRSMTINLGDELWIPVEITMIGRTDFLEAWRKGAEEWNAMEEEPEERGFHVTGKAQETYRPVGLTETDLGLQYGDRQSIISGFSNDAESLVDLIVGKYLSEAKTHNRARDWNRLGIVYARFMRYSRAQEAFSNAIAIKPDYLDAEINGANLLFLQGKYPGALAGYQRALATAGQRGTASTSLCKLLINLSRTCYQLTEYDKAREYYSRAAETDPVGAREFSYLASSGIEDAARAAAVDLLNGVLFFEGETDDEE